MFGGQHTSVEEKLQAAEAALQGTEPDDRTQDLVGRIASMRATLAVIQHDGETIITQSRRALEYLHEGNLPVRTATTWTLGYAYQLQGDRAAARGAYTEVISIGKSFGDSIYTLAATINLGQLQEADNQLSLAAESYRRSLQLAGDPPQRMACEAHLGLARICYEWNDLEAALAHGQQSAQLARQLTVDTLAAYGVFVARLKLAQGDVSGAAAALDEAEAYVRRYSFVFRMPDVAAAQVLLLLHQGHLAAAAHLAHLHDLPISQARVHLAQGDTSTALVGWSHCASKRRQGVGRMSSSRRWFSRRLLCRRMANRTRLCTCSVTRWRSPSRAASSVSLSTKVPRWRTSCLKQRLLG